MFESVESTFCTDWTRAVLIGSYIVIGVPSIGLNTVTAR